MVHHEYKGHIKKNQETADCNNTQKMRRAPFAMDQSAVTESSNKSASIPEQRKIGYGVRQEKALKSDAKKKTQPGISLKK